MDDKRKKKDVLIEELNLLRGQVAELSENNKSLEEYIQKQTNALEAATDQLRQDINRRKQVEVEREKLLVSEQELRLLAETFSEVTLALTAQLEEEAVLDEILYQAERLIPYAAAHIVMLNGDDLTIGHWRGYEKFGSEEYISTLHQQLSHLPSETEAVQLKRPLIISDTHSDPRWVIVPETQWVRSYAVVPIYSRNMILGLLRLDSEVPSQFSAYDVARLQPLTNAAAMALENSRLHAAEQNQLHQIQQSQHQLIQSEKMAAMGRLAASVTHEINNPLQSIQSCVTLMREDLAEALDEADLVDIANIAEQEIERISNLIHRMRAFYNKPDVVPEFSPKTTGQTSLDTLNAFYSPDVSRWQLVDVHTILTDVLQLAGKELDRKGISVEQHWATSLPKIQANANYLKQIFLNLVLNATEAMSEQGGVLTIQTEPEKVILTSQVSSLSTMPDIPRAWQNKSQNGMRATGIKIEFTDTGSGISQDKLARLFEPLFTTKEKGSGLGLFTTYKIVEAHQGQITVESAINHGTTFAVLLPLTQS